MQPRAKNLMMKHFHLNIFSLLLWLDPLFYKNTQQNQQREICFSKKPSLLWLCWNNCCDLNEGCFLCMLLKFKFVCYAVLLDFWFLKKYTSEPDWEELYSFNEHGFRLFAQQRLFVGSNHIAQLANWLTNGMVGDFVTK